MVARNSRLFRAIPLILIVVLLCPFAYGTVIFVDDDAVGANVGSSWVDAITSLQDAILLAYFYDKPVEIRVAQGFYSPDQGLGIMAGDREASFQLINGVTIKGGYAGLSDRPTDSRDIDRYKTILSGDLEQNDSSDFANILENSYHVVDCSGVDRTAVLDGVTISAGGNTDGVGRSGDSEETMGGGMYNNYGNPILMNCTFSGNIGRFGAGVYNHSGSPLFVDCTFGGNSSGYKGGGMFNDSSDPKLLNCAFIGNSADSEGGGMYNSNSNPVLTNCTFNENTGSSGGALCNYISEPMLADCDFNSNSTSWGGGAVCNYGSTSTFLGCTFKENSAVREGGGILNDSSSRMKLTNCIFCRNSARNGGAINNSSYGIFDSIYSNFYEMDDNSSAMYLLNCTFNGNFAESGGGAIFSDIRYRLVDELTGLDNQAILINCILWGDTPDEIRETMGESIWSETGEYMAAFYNNVQGGFPGEGNIDMDPVFADPNSGDYHLKSQAGRWDPTSQSWGIDQISSPCIDAGDMDVPVGLERFPNGGRINMGAYGGTPEGSLSPPDLPLLYSQAYNPYPPDGALGVDEDVILSWMAGFNADMHDVYFGIDESVVANADMSSAVYQGRQAVTSFNPSDSGGLRNGVYYWRIDEVYIEGRIVKGEIWEFSTRGPVKGRTCFIGQTGVWIDGALVPISKIAAGRVISGIGGLNPVEQVQEHDGTFTCYDILLESGKKMTVAENHVFMTDSRRWLSLKDLKAGLRLKTVKGSIGITSITKKPELYVGRVYNLKIDGSDQYMVGEDAVIVRDY